jgi:cobalamin biosynthesis protein CobT
LSLELKRVRLQSLARVLSGKGNLSLTFGKVPCTDLKNITLISFEKEIEKGVAASRAECWLSEKATCAHEAGHIRFTSKDVWEKAVRHSRQMTTLLNIVEDSRIERCMANAFPGTLMWFRFSNEYIFSNRKDWGTGPKALYGGLISYALVGMIPKPIKEQEEIANLIEKCAKYLDMGRVEKDTQGAYECCAKIWDIIKDFVGSYMPAGSLPGTLGTKSPEKAPDGELDPRREPKKAPKKEPKRDEYSEEGSESSPAGDETKESPESEERKSGEDGRKKAEPDTDKEENIGELGSSDEPSSESDTSSETGLTDESASISESESSDGSSSGSEVADKLDTSGESDYSDEPHSTEDSSDKTGSGIPEDSHDEPEEAYESSGESGEMYDSSDELEETDDTDGSEGTDSGYPESSGEMDGLEPPEDECLEPPDDFFGDSGILDNSTGSGDSHDGFDHGDDECPEGTDGDCAGEMDCPGPSGMSTGYSEDEPADYDDIDMGDYEGLLGEVEDELEKLKEAASRAEKFEPAESPRISEEEVTVELSRGIHDGCVFILRTLKSDRDTKCRYEEMYKGIKGHVNKTVNEIRKILEYKATLKERNLRKGALDSGSLWKLRVKDTKVFCKVREPNDTPKMVIYLLVDCSGSMRMKKMEYAKESACLLYEVCQKLKIPVNVTGFTGEVSSHRDVTHLRVVDFDDAPDKKYSIAGLGALLQNRDGYSIRVAKKELLLRNEPQKVLMVLSDGMPAMPYKKYLLKPGEDDTSLAVREAEKSGIGVIGLFFGNAEDVPHAQKIYNNLIYVKDVSVLPLAVARVLKKTIERLG